MQQVIQITPEESQKVSNLFYTYTSYLNILGYLASKKNLEDNGLYDKKWSEAVILNRTLEAAKRDIEKKYKPEGTWDRFEFNFDENQVIFTKDDGS